MANTKEYKKEYRKNNSEKIRKYQKQYDKQYNIKNKEKRNKQAKQWREDNREAALEYNKQWYLDHKEEMKEYSKQQYKDNLKYIKQYRIDHREHRNEYNKQWREENPGYNKQYRKTPKGKLNCQKDSHRRRGLGFIPLNEPFEGSEGHHISENFVIFIPAEIHRKIKHCIWTWKNMDKINRLAIKYLMEFEPTQWQDMKGLSMDFQAIVKEHWDINKL